MQVLDFALGFVGIDIARDDGRHLGLWPWESDERRPSQAAEWLHRTVFGEATRSRPTRLVAKPAPEPRSVRGPSREPAPSRKPERTDLAPARPAPTPAAPRRSAKVEFCTRCFGRAYPPEAVAAAGDGSPFEHLTPEQKAWPGRWCDCWARREVADSKELRR